MRIAGRQIPLGEKNLLPIFCAGIVAGIVIMNIGKSILLENTGLFDEDTLYHMKYITVDGSALFCFVLRKRIMLLLVVAILATTYLGYVVCVGTAGWCGMSVGVFLSVLVARYGIKGVILALVSVFPQAICYVPAIVLMLGWSQSLYRAIYSRGLSSEVGDKAFVIKKLGWLGGIGIVVILGCVLEGYVNPRLLLGYLKTF